MYIIQRRHYNIVCVPRGEGDVVSGVLFVKRCKLNDDVRQKQKNKKYIIINIVGLSRSTIMLQGPESFSEKNRFRNRNPSKIPVSKITGRHFQISGFYG